MAKFSTEQVGNVFVIDAKGRITLGGGSRLFRETLLNLVKEGRRKFVLNLGKVSHVDTSGIAEMVSGALAVQRVGGRIILVALRNSSAINLPHQIKLYTYFEVCQTRVEAVVAFYRS